MPQIPKILGLPALAALAAITMAPAAPLAATSNPVVVELFQSQGCSSCPPANANINAIADHADVLALSYGVTYWDDLGWKDTFASPRFTARQWDYARSLKHDNVGTPQVVIDGRRDLVGADRGKLTAAIAAARRPKGPMVELLSGLVKIGSGPVPDQAANVWLVRYDPRVREVPIRRGENGGKTLPHKNIVVEFTSLGHWSGRSASYRIPPPATPGLATAILVQTGVAGPILAAAKG